jgi:hypothetical protein
MMHSQQNVKFSIRTVGNTENIGLFNDIFSNHGAHAGVSSLSTVNMEKASCSETLEPLLTILDGISSNLLRPESN